MAETILKSAIPTQAKAPKETGFFVSGFPYRFKYKGQTLVPDAFGKYNPDSKEQIEALKHWASTGLINEVK